MDARQVVYTNKAHCRDCYRCLRSCPVKAIRMERGQAYVVPELCISCGTCIRECPQGAKQFRDDVERAIKLVEQTPLVAVSVAPSYAAIYSGSTRRRLASGLRRLGFGYVGETAVGAYMVAVETSRIANAESDKSHICTACPAVVKYIELYEPDKVKLLTPITSPMIAHAKLIKHTLGTDVPIVFVGPCVAKKAEAERPENSGFVDVVLTFAELEAWFTREAISLATCEESRFDDSPNGEARLFPIVGGSLRTASLTTDILSNHVLCADGIDDVKEALACAGGGAGPVVVEPLFCSHGCINGPAMLLSDSTNASIFKRRNNILEHASSLQSLAHRAAPEPSPVSVNLSTHFSASPAHFLPEVITEEQIRSVLEHTGKSSPENQLNCGACGYPSCQDKAIAVIRGMAESEMCIPYMKRLAEQRTDRIIETSPNGIVILDERLHILSMNPAFRTFFMCSEAVVGRHISYLMDPAPFELLTTGTVRHDKYNLVCHQIVYELPDEKQYVGIFVDVTKNRAHKERLDMLRGQTISQARELIDHQVRMAQTMAKFLGESSAQGESLLEKLIVLAEGRDGTDG